MLAITLLSLYLIVLTLATATARGGPVALTERGSAVLVWLEQHPRPGTPRSRAYARRRFTRMVFRGLRLSGVYYPFMCIHSKEGSWTAHNSPYGGGLQEDEGFQRTYGGEYIALWGSAGYWPPWAQMVAAFRAYRGYGGYGPRYFYPWPNTARDCGLIR